MKLQHLNHQVTKILSQNPILYQGTLWYNCDILLLNITVFVMGKINCFYGHVQLRKRLVVNQRLSGKHWTMKKAAYKIRDMSIQHFVKSWLLLMLQTYRHRTSPHFPWFNATIWLPKLSIQFVEPRQSSVQNPCWLMIGSGIKNSPLYLGEKEKSSKLPGNPVTNQDSME